MRMFFLLGMILGFPALWAQKIEIGPHVLSGGFVGTRTTMIGVGNNANNPRFSSRIPEAGVVRSKGSYLIAGIEIGEVVLRTQSGSVINEFIDIPLLRTHNLVEKSAQSSTAEPADPNSELSKRLIAFLDDGLGKRISSYSVPGEKGASSKTATLWRLKHGKSSISIRLELFFANDELYLTNKNPHFARLLIQIVPDIESVVFDPSIFTLKKHELIEKLSLVGLSIDANKITPAKILEAEVDLKVNAVLDRLQNIEIRFLGDIPTRSIVLNKYRDPFINAANSVITDKLRSFPTELTNTNVSYSSRDYLLYDPAGDSYYTYTDVYEHRNQEVKLIWSPGRGTANYRLSGRRLEILPPGFGVAKAIDPTLGGLVSGNAFNQSISGDFNLPALSFRDFQNNLNQSALGKWIDLPMENQGDLPLCLPASMARILRYFGRQVNQYTVAEVGGIDMRGTNWKQLTSIIRVVCEKMNLKYRHLDKKSDLGVFVKDSIDNGLPVLWLVPGHARIINGYSPRKGTILYTDSWGEGFEVREMPYAEALEMTDFAICFLPPNAIK